MKTVVKIFTLVLVAVFLLSSTVMAMPLNTVVIGDKAYSIDSIIHGTATGIQAALDASDGKLYYSIDGQTNGFVGLFNGQTMTQAQKDELRNIELTKADGTKQIFATFDQELTVNSATAVNATTISVIFNDSVTQQFTVDTLAAGANTRTVSYLGNSYTVDVTYTPPIVVATAVQDVRFDNYRHFQVIFNGLVDLDSAKKAENYYFFINEGNADYKATLPASNQLDTIGATIDANNVDGKTVADIYLPEDARFTNIADFLPSCPSEPTAEYLTQIPLYNFWTEAYGFDTQAWLDDEQTIVVNKANDVHGVNSSYYALTAGKEVQVAVRNIRDVNGQRSIDTVVKPMLIKDETRPAWNGVCAVDASDLPVSELFSTSSVPVVTIYTDNSDRIRLQFNEPVFDTHGLGVADINNTGHYDVQVAVDDNKVASTQDLNLEGPNGILKFYMAADDNYAKASLVDLDIKKAIKRAYTDGFRADNTYDIKITGITDLAGNLTAPQVLEFKVKLIDRNGSDPKVIPAPQIIKVEQIHDNVFRVYANRSDVKGKFEIRNGDGEDGLIQYPIGNLDATKVDGQDVWYKDVIVPAVDMEKSLGIGVRDDQLLAYDGQNTLVRTLRVFDVADKTDDLTGNSYERLLTNDPFIIKKDIYAPVVLTPADIKWDAVNGTTGTTITLDVKDIVPDTWVDVGQPVYAMLYDYKTTHVANNAEFGVFDFNSIDTLATEAYNMGLYADPNVFEGFDLLPVTVSYTKDGVKHTAIVTNRNLLEETANFDDESARHYGAPYSISYNCSAKQLTLNLAPGENQDLWYKDLLDSNGKLVQGVTYEIEIPNGYFADQGKFNAYDFNNWDSNNVNTSNAAWFVPDDKILYVSDGRNNNSIVRKNRPYNYVSLIGDGSESYMVHGYTSTAAVVNQKVGVAPVVPEEPKDAVPQTSKELINWFEDRNEIWVEFTGSIDANTLKNPANYILNDLSLAAMGVTSNDIKYVVSTENEWNGEPRQFAEIKLPYDTISVDGDYSFKVSGVSNAAGGTMTPVEVRLDIDENFRPVIEKAIVIGDHEIELTFNESVRYTADPAINPEQLAVAAKDNFKVKVNGTEYTPMTATVGTTPLTPNDNPKPTYPLNKVVRLDLGSVELLGNGLTITVDVVKNQNGKLLMEDSKCNPLNDDVAPFVIH